MTPADLWRELRDRVRTEWRHLTTIHPSDRRWQMPLTATLCSGLPLMVSVYFDHLDYGLVASLGGLAFLYLPDTPMYHRMVALMTCAFGMTACYALGLMSHLFLPAMIPVIGFTSILVTMICRYYGLGPPGSLFFIMAVSIGAYSPLEITQLPLKVGLIFMGTLLACLIAFFYSLHILRLQAPAPVPPLPRATFDFVVFDSVVIGAFVGISLALAQALQLERPYWVPVSCLAVIQGASLRAVWNRQLHRVVGTGIGLLVSWGLLLLPMGPWTISLTMMALTFVIEMTVLRHYGFATIFITPLTILLAEAATLDHASPTLLMQARFFDTLLGCFVGLVGGFCLHSPRFRTAAGHQLLRLIPSRFKR